MENCSISTPCVVDSQYTSHTWLPSAQERFLKQLPIRTPRHGDDDEYSPKYRIPGLEAEETDGWPPSLRSHSPQLSNTGLMTPSIFTAPPHGRPNVQSRNAICIAYPSPPLLAPWYSMSTRYCEESVPALYHWQPLNVRFASAPEVEVAHW